MWRLRATAARCGGAGKSQQGRASGGRVSWRARWWVLEQRGQLAEQELTGEGRQAVEQSNREKQRGRGERKTMRTPP
jgi:hypothetical protein